MQNHNGDSWSPKGHTSRLSWVRAPIDYVEYYRVENHYYVTWHIGEEQCFLNESIQYI